MTAGGGAGVGQTDLTDDGFKHPKYAPLPSCLLLIYLWRADTTMDLRSKGTKGNEWTEATSGSIGPKKVTMQAFNALVFVIIGTPQ